MDPELELPERRGASQPSMAQDTVDTNVDQRYTIRRKPVSWARHKFTDNTGHSGATGNRSSSQPLMASDHVTRDDKMRKSSTYAPTVSDDAPNPQYTDCSGRYLPPKPLKPLTNAQLSLLIVELLAVVALGIAGIKGLTILPYIDIAAVPPLSQDCGGYSVPSVERNFYINLQIMKELSFTKAKLLDLAWDTIIGQGGKFLHGWVLYQVVASQIAWMMEYASVPYHFQLNLLFSTVSLSALWSTIRFLSSKQPRRTILSAVWFLLAISYLLAFSSIWSAATGYLNPSTPGYEMADKSYATIDSESLRLCWSVNAERLNGVVPPVVLGPRLGDCIESLSTLTMSPSCNLESLENGPDDWRNLFAYLQTKRTVQNFLGGVNTHEALNETANMNDEHYDYTPEAYFIEGVGFGYVYQIPGFYREFTGFQFVGAGQDPQVENRTDEPWLNMTFQLDTSVNMSTWRPGEALDPVPYNSTLWFNGSAIALDAPFLNIPANETDCQWFDLTGLCICYGDTLLTSDFRQDNNLICISEAGYVWGFSSVITLIGIIIEVCWIIGCFGMWLDVHINSTLLRMNRPASGLVRNILDIAGAIQRDLGNDTGAYKDRELVKALEKCSPVRYEVEDTGGKVDRIVMVSVPAAQGRRSRLRINSSALYA